MTALSEWAAACWFGGASWGKVERGREEKGVQIFVKETDEPMCVRGVEKSRGRSDSRASGLVLLLSGGKVDRWWTEQASVSWMGFHQLRIGRWSVTVSGWHRLLLVTLSCPHVWQEDISLPEQWLGTCRMVQGNVLSRPGLELGCYRDCCFCSGSESVEWMS